MSTRDDEAREWANTRADRAEALLGAVETTKTTGGSVQIAGVRIEPCDTHGVTESARGAQAFVAEYRALTSALGYGDDVTEPAATPSQADAEEHSECPVWCDECDWWERPRSCAPCHGSGCGPGTALGAFDLCSECGGDGRDHLPYTLSGTWGHTITPDDQVRLVELLEEARHVIQFTDDGWTVQHPLTERLRGTLFDCEVGYEGCDPGVRGEYWLSADGSVGGPYGAPR